MTRFLSRKVQRDLVGYAYAVAFEGYNFFRMVCYDADVLQAQIDQDLGADAAFVLHHALAGRLAIELAARMEMNLGQLAGRFRGVNRESAPRVVQRQKHPAAFL